MTAKEQERLAVVETKVDNICEDVQEIKKLIAEQNKVIEGQANKYVTWKALTLVIAALSISIGAFSFLIRVAGV